MALLAELYDARWTLLSALFAVYAVNKYLTYQRLAAFPGPFSTGWFDFWHAWVILRMRSHLAYEEVIEQYGSIARVGPNELVTSSPELLTHMSAVRSSYSRAPWFNRATRVEPGKDHVFSQIDEAKHMKRRQQMAAGYSGKENLALEPSIDARVVELINLLRTKYLSSDGHSKPFDLARKIQYFTLDVISSVGFGQAFGDLEADTDLNDYIKSGEEGLMVVTILAALGLTRFMQWPPLARLLGPSEKDARGFGKMQGVVRSIIDWRLTQPLEGRSDMLASFMHHGLNREDLFTEALLQVLAGSDTTAAALRCIMLYLVTHPRVYTKLQAEIDEAVVSGKATGPDGVVSEACAREMKYLQAVIREGLRVHPPVTDAVPKRVPDGGDTVVVESKDVYLPGGTNISYAAYGIHHDKRIFGEDAPYFRPERWLLDDSEQERLTAMQRTTELIFGYGKYQCLGKPVAWLEIQKVVFEFLHHFDWSLCKPATPWKETNFVGIFAHEHMWVTVVDRKAKA